MTETETQTAEAQATESAESARNAVTPVPLKNAKNAGNARDPQSAKRKHAMFGDDVRPGTFHRLAAYVLHYRWRVATVALLLIIDAGIITLSSVANQNLVDDYIMPLVGKPHPDFGPLIRFLTVLAVLYIISALTAWARPLILVKVEQGTLKTIRDQMYAHMQRLPIGYFDRNEHGDIMSRYTNDTDTLRQAISEAFPQILYDGFSVLCTLIGMLWVSVPLTLVTLVLTAAIMVGNNVLVSRSGRYFGRQQKDLGKVNGFVDEAVNGQKVIKVFTHEDATEAQFDRFNDSLNHSSSLANIYGNLPGPVVNNLGFLVYVIVAIIGSAGALGNWGNPTLHGGTVLTTGAIIAFLTLCRSFINPMGEIAQQVTQVLMALAGASRIFELLDEPVEEDHGTVTLVNANVADDGTITPADHRTDEWAWRVPVGVKVNTHDAEVTVAADADDAAAKAVVPERTGAYTRLRGDIRLDHVDFSYVPGHQILHDISIHATPGEKVALVGATGAGKTTITNLVNRFYDIDSGSITYDGIDIRDIAKPDLRRSMGIVLQDVNLFTGTVMDNIRYGRLNASDSDCVAAAKLANADGFIRMLPDGYRTILTNNGSDLSQGQRQLISIARAAVADPPVMILDEATSSIDTRTEQIVQRGMDRLMKGRTVFVIAHRLSTIRNSDQICVIDHGRIIERGNHDELIAKRGEYYQLYTGALELE
jgi:ATP-binding cassette subfamily B multidrug efflux pump